MSRFRLGGACASRFRLGGADSMKPSRVRLPHDVAIPADRHWPSSVTKPPACSPERPGGFAVPPAILVPVGESCPLSRFLVTFASAPGGSTSASVAASKVDENRRWGRRSQRWTRIAKVDETVDVNLW